MIRIFPSFLIAVLFYFFIVVVHVKILKTTLHHSTKYFLSYGKCPKEY